MKLLLRLLVIGVLMGGSLTMTQAQSNGVSDARFARLAKGINLPLWFWYAPSTDTGIETRFADEEFAMMREMGLTFVRVPIDLDFVFDADSADLLNAHNLAHIDRALERLIAHDLAVIVDLHSTSLADSNNAVYSGKLEDDSGFVDTFEQFWRSFGAHLSSTTDPEMVFFTVMNEPVFENNTAAWIPIQERLLGAVREVAPEHTLIATGALWSNISTLIAMEPLDDPNIVYDFHFYEPFLFTHQGAEWSWYVVKPLRGVPYPSSPEAVQPAIDRLNDEEIQGYLRNYGEERWDKARVAAMIERAANWATEHNVRLICSEFGTYSNYAPAADRVQWIEDVRTTFESLGIGWSMWEYDSSFGLVKRLSSRTVQVDEAVAQALGLTVPQDE